LKLSKKLVKASGGALRVGTFFGIPVKIHWTFGLLLIFLLISAYRNGLDTKQTIGFILFFMCVFVCVVMHEYGHALMARKFKVKTQDIILSPIGGVARLEELPSKPSQELLIAIAGPMVNVVIAVILTVILKFGFNEGWPDIDNFNFDKPLEFLGNVAYVNMALFAFNLVPAFPMDGGRILRSVLAMNMDKVAATKIASNIGRVIAIGFIIIGILGQQLSLSLIGIFIFMMAGMEYRNLRISSMLHKTQAGDIMRDKYTQVVKTDDYNKLAELYYRAGEKNFLVFNEDSDIIGSVPELFVRDAIRKNIKHLTVGERMSEKFGIVPYTAPLDKLMDLMKEKGWAIVGVEHENFLVGVVDRKGIEDFIILKGT